MKVRLTTSFVLKAICPAGQAKVTFFDTNHTGLMLEVRVSGRKTFYQRYTDRRGTERQFKLGPADVITVEQARRKGRQIRADALLGPDPREKRFELRRSITFVSFIRERYLPHVQAYKRSWKTDETILRLHILPAIGNRYMDEICTDHIAAMMKNMRQRGYAVATRNRALVICRFCFNLAMRWRIPGLSYNPTAPLPLGPKVHLERYISVSETSRLLSALSQDENRVAADAILLLLLTGARRNEITQARWEYVDRKRCTLLVPQSKSGKSRSITLSEPAMRLLRSIKPVKGNPFIFPSPITGRPSPSLFYPWNRIRKVADLNDVRLHDLRHSFASFLVNSGVSIYAVQKLLGHAYIETTQRYAHLSSDTLKDAAETAAKVIEKAGSAVRLE